MNTNALPLYVSIKQALIDLILKEGLNPSFVFPSIRELAVSHQVNPLTIRKAYQALIDEGILEAKRGQLYQLVPGAAERLMEIERERFLNQEWPLIQERIKRLGLERQCLNTSLFK